MGKSPRKRFNRPRKKWAIKYLAASCILMSSHFPGRRSFPGRMLLTSCVVRGERRCRANVMSVAPALFAGHTMRGIGPSVRGFISPPNIYMHRKCEVRGSKCRFPFTARNFKCSYPSFYLINFHNYFFKIYLYCL